MKGELLLKKRIGHKLQDGMIQSFCMNSQLEDVINVLYLKFDHWLHITVSDEETRIKEVDGHEPEKIETFIVNGSIFDFPLIKIEKEYEQFTDYVGKQLIDIKELVWIKNEDQSHGLNLYFEDKLNLIIHNKIVEDDGYNELIFENKIPEDLKEKCIQGHTFRKR